MFRSSERRSTLKSLALVAGVAVTSWALTGCNDDEGVNPVGIQEDPAALRAIHLSPNAPGVDVFLNAGSQPAVTNLEFEQGTSYLEVQAGTYQIDVAPNGSTAGEAVLSVPGLELTPGTSYTAVAYNELGNISALALVDDLSAVSEGQIRVRAIHTAAAVGQVDILNIPSSGMQTALYEDVDLGVAGGYKTLPAGAYTIGFDVNNDASPDVVFALPSLPAGTIANVFAVSDTGGTVFLLAQLQDGTVARIDAQ